jgi:hypothetical protein
MTRHNPAVSFPGGAPSASGGCWWAVAAWLLEAFGQSLLMASGRTLGHFSSLRAVREERVAVTSDLPIGRLRQQ